MEQAKKQDAAPAVAPVSTEGSRGFFWFVAQGDTLKGPYSTNELKKLIDKKEVSEKFFAWRDGFREWRPVYGIEEFKSDKQSDAAYPTVAVPGIAGISSPTAPTAAAREKSVQVYKVRFNQSRWSDLKKTEVLGFFLISLAFTMGILYLATKVFEREWSQIWGRRASAMVLNLGRQPAAIPVYLAEPLLSAPGLKHQDEHYLAIETEGDLPRFTNNQINGFQVDSPLPKDTTQDLSWDKSHIYTRRVKLQGVIDLKRPGAIQIEAEGLPFEPLLSPRLAK